MSLFDLSALPQIERLTDEVRGCRLALETIATVMVKLTEIPEPVLPDKPAGADAVGSYSTHIASLEDEDAEAIRNRLRAASLSDEQIEEQVLGFFRSEDDSTE
jgi:hypothetical protein